MFSGKGLWTVGMQKERLFVRISVDFGHPNHHAGYTTMPGPCGAQLGSDAPELPGPQGLGLGLRLPSLPTQCMSRMPTARQAAAFDPAELVSPS